MIIRCKNLGFYNEKKKILRHAWCIEPQTKFNFYAETLPLGSRKMDELFDELRNIIVAKTEEYLVSKGYPEIKVSFVTGILGSHFELDLTGNTSQLTHFKLKYL